ncbi:MAG: hypothetical protein IH595_10970 [Bacteroidales bacterium]|nr:hypothetical protein [Bacteroidales bacterium]
MLIVIAAVAVIVRFVQRRRL